MALKIRNSWKIIPFILGLAPLFSWLYAISQNNLTADPVKALLHGSGGWAITFICITLALTPLTRQLKQSWAGKLRRMSGLFCAFYAVLHVLIFFSLDLEGRWREFATEVVERPYLVFGLFAFLILIALAGTSFKAMQRRLGRRWKPLHRMVYLAAVASCVHFLLSQKLDRDLAWLAFAVIAALLLLRSNPPAKIGQKVTT